MAKLILNVPDRQADGEWWQLEFADYSSHGTQITLRDPLGIDVAQVAIDQSTADSIKLLVHGEI